MTPNGDVLDGEGDGITGGDYSYKFRVYGSNDRIISISDIALTPGSDVDIPVSLDRVNGLARLQFELKYNPDLLDITAVNPNKTLFSDWDTTSEIDRDNGIVKVAIDGDKRSIRNYNEYRSFDLVSLEAVVPDTASYGETQILDLVNVYSNLDVLDNDAIHRVIQAGDVTGDGTISGLDAHQMMGVSVGLDDGFDSFAAIDPILAGDLNGDGVISAFDASFLLGN